MRQCRGKTVNTKRWAYGWYCQVDGKHYIINPDAELAKCGCGGHGFTGFVEVIPETVSQSTGIEDKNGKEAYANDKIVVRDGDYKATGIVIWCEDVGQWMWKAIDTSNAMTIATGQTIPLWEILDKQYRYQGEIIGNIHDNPALLEQKE